MRNYKISVDDDGFIWHKDGDYLIQRYDSGNNFIYIVSFIGIRMFGFNIRINKK